MIPNGWFVEGMLFWGDTLSKQTNLSKGCYLEIEDMASLSNATLNELHMQLETFLAQIGEEFMCQIQWTVDSDYHEVLENYNKITNTRCKHALSEYVRMEKYNKYKRMMKKGQLRRERLSLFFTTQCDTVPKKGFKLEDQILAYIRQKRDQLMDKIGMVANLIPYAQVKPMSDSDHYAFMRRFFNPSISYSLRDKDIKKGFLPYASIRANCLSSDGITNEMDDYWSFKWDGYHHAILVLRNFPGKTVPSLINTLTRSCHRECVITQNIYPMSVEREINKEETAAKRIEGEAIHKKEHRKFSVVRKKRQKIDNLMTGDILPFKVLTVVRIWDKKPEKLQAKVTAVKLAMEGMRGAKVHVSNHPKQLEKLFFATTPGWGNSGREWSIYGESSFLADMIPFSNSYNGAVKEGEALYDGVHGNLVGVRSFSNSTPQHAILLGQTRAGKSVNIADFMTQSDPFFDFTCIVEEGLTFGMWTKAMGYEPIILTPSSNITINYFDTLGNPLDQSQIAIATALCMLMVGSTASDDVNKMRAGIIGEFIQQLYWDHYHDWLRDNEEREEEVIQLAYAIYIMDQKSFDKTKTMVDHYVDLKEYEKNDIDKYRHLMDVDLNDAIEFSKDPSTEKYVRDVAFAFFEPDEFPTHAELVEFLTLQKRSHHNAEELHTIAKMLRAWTADQGSYGGLFDGVTKNIDITGNIVHFELGYIPEALVELKEAASFLISNFVRQYVTTMPRGKRKRFIIEEVRRFVDIKGGDKVLSELYAQMGKFSTWVICVSQQYAQLKNSPIIDVVLNNSKQYWLMRQQDRNDVDEIGDRIVLPESFRGSIRGYTLPEHQPKNQKASYLCQFAPEGYRSNCGTVVNRASDVMVYVSSSDGDVFETRAKELDAYDDVFLGVLEQVTLKQQEDRVLNSQDEDEVEEWIEEELV